MGKGQRMEGCRERERKERETHTHRETGRGNHCLTWETAENQHDLHFLLVMFFKFVFLPAGIQVHQSYCEEKWNLYIRI